MRRILVLVVVCCLTLSGTLFAALGNTEEEVADLFGKPVDQRSPDSKGVATNTYEKGNYMILVQFLKGLSMAESYTRVDKQELSQSEIDAFLEGSSNDRAWNKDPKQQEWQRDDRKARAWIQTISGRSTLLIQAQ